MTTVPRQRGFTMIEVAVVMLLIVIVTSMVSLRLGEDENSQLRYEAKRLAMLLQTAQEEAILRGQTIVMTIEPKGYYFTSGNSDKLESQGLHSRPLPRGMKFSSVTINGVSDAKDSLYLLTVPATGEVPPFTFILKLGKYRWKLEGEFGGEIKTSAPESEEGDLNV